MIETFALEDNLPLEGVWQSVPAASPGEDMAYLFRLGGHLLLARLGGTPQGYALWSVETLPEDAVEVELPSGFTGASVRRVVCSLVPAGDDVDMALVLDAGMDRCLYFTPVDGEHAACSMQPAAGAGDVQETVCLGARFPENVVLPAEVVSRARLLFRLFGLSSAVLLSAGVCGFVLSEPWLIEVLLGLCFALAGSAFFLLKKRAEVCPWCDSKALYVESYNEMCCKKCHNYCRIPEHKK